MLYRIHLLGRFRVLRDGLEITAWPRAAPRRLLKLLALAPRRELTVGGLAAALWPHDEGNRARQRLHHLVYLLRSTLERGASGAEQGARVVELREGLVRLAVAGIWLDVDEFEEQLDEAMRTAQRGAALQRVLALYEGPLLPGDTEDEAINVRRTALARRFVAGLGAAAREHLKAGETAQAVRCLQQVVALAPADEAAHRELIRIYAQLGQRDQAERQYAECKSALAEELGVVPSADTHQAYRDAMLGDSRVPLSEGRANRSAESSGTDRPNRFVPPVPTGSLVGRDPLLRDVVAALNDGVRLVTLTGAGGIGKTQLALHVAKALAPSFGSGVCFVALAEVTGEGVLDRLRRALRVADSASKSTRDALVDALRDVHLLLVCDNCEHVAAQMGILTSLLARCPLLQVLSTSRRRLNLQAEQVFVVPGLALTRDAAVQLFAERARAVQPGFVLDHDNLADVEAIVRRLEGLPLSIELVAARSHAFAPSELRHALDSGFGFVAGGGPDRPARQRSFDQSLAWSLALLAPLERQVLDRVALFAAPFEFDALAAVCTDLAPDISLPVQSLIEMNLLARAPDTAGLQVPRLQLLASTGEFMRRHRGQDQPSETGALRLAGWYADLALRLDPELGTARAAQALAVFDADHENFFAALDGADRLDAPELTCRLVKGLCRYWVRSGSWARADRWIERAIEVSPALPAAERAKLFLAVGGYWHECQQFAHTRSLALSAMDLAQASADARLQVRATLLFSAASFHLGEAHATIDPLIRARDAALALGDIDLQRVAMNNLGSFYLSDGELGRARRIWTECDDGFGGAMVQARVATLSNLALAAHYGGHYDEAIGLSIRAAELEAQPSPRPARLALILVRQSWMWCCRGLAAQATESLRHAREVASGARLTLWERLCAAHGGKVALVNGHIEQASALLARGIQACGSLADPWDLLDLRLWLFWARMAEPDGPAAAGGVLTDLLAMSVRSFRHEHARILEAAAAWLVHERRFDAARRAWLQAEALRKRQAIRRFPFEQAQARRTQTALRAKFGAAWKTDAPNAVASEREDLTWLVTATR